MSRTLSIRVTDEVFSRLQEEAEKRGISLSDVVRVRLQPNNSTWEWRTSMAGTVRSFLRKQTGTQYPSKNIKHDPRRDG